MRALHTLGVLLALSSGAFAQSARSTPLPAMRVLVPAYFYPVVGSPWDRLELVAARHPGLIWAIGNPASGPGASSDPSYVATFRAFQRQRGQLLGYVASSYGSKPLASLFAEIDLWFLWYDAGGIFVDEMDNTPGAHEAYYHAVFDYVRSAQPSARVVANPGTSTTLDYLDGAFGRCASAVCIFESSTSFAAWSADPWVATRARREFYALPYAVGAADWQAAADHAFQQNAGWFYTTDDVLPNPWDTLPPYFEALADYIDATY